MRRGLVLCVAQLLPLLLLVCVDGIHASRFHRQQENAENKVQLKEIELFVGVQTGFQHSKRRALMREMWFPDSPDKLLRLERDHSLVLRFVIGYHDDWGKMDEITEEHKKYGGFLRIPQLERYHSLTRKTHTFFKTVLRLYDPRFLMKVDDDVFVQMPRLPLLAPQYTFLRKDYIGCFMYNTSIVTNSSGNLKHWYEPQHSMLGSKYVSYARGSTYVLSRKALRLLATVPPGGLRYFRSEDVTVGTWMASFNVTYFDDRRLCQAECDGSSLVIHETKMCTSCDPRRFLEKHKNSRACQSLPDREEHGWIPVVQPKYAFVRMGEDGHIIQEDDGLPEPPPLRTTNEKEDEQERAQREKDAQKAEGGTGTQHAGTENTATENTETGNSVTEHAATENAVDQVAT